MTLKNYLQTRDGNQVEGDLIDIVSDAASHLASNANNGGLSEQLEFLLQNGWSESEIIDRLKEMDCGEEVSS